MPRDVAYRVTSALNPVFLNETDADRRHALLRALLPHAVARQMEAGSMDVISRSTTPGLDLHNTVDGFVLAGIMSPCPGRSITSGLAWYELTGRYTSVGLDRTLHC
jgi:hypothetical protein